MIDLSAKIESLQASPHADKYSPEGMDRLKETLKSYEGEDQLLWWSDIEAEMANEPEQVLHPTGVGQLDELIGGFREHQLAIVAGDSSHGKTLFGMFLLHCLESLNPLMIPLEQSARELIDQRRSNGFELPVILSPRVPVDRPGTDWIEERIVEGIAKFNTKLVLIDHLGYIDNTGPNGINRRENVPYRIGEVMRDLKSIAKRWNMIIILPVHISQHDESKPPSRMDIKNSSDVIQEADIGFFVWRKNSMQNKIRIYEDKTMVSIQKNRRTGKNGNFGLVFNSMTGWYNEEDSWVKQMEEMARMEVEAENQWDSL